MLNTQDQIITSTAQISGNMSALPAGIIKHPKPLSNHHYMLTGSDISPAAQLSNNILRGRIDNRDPNKPFVVTAFENHSTISHIILRTEFLARFALHKAAQPDDKSRDFIYADELPHNLLSDFITKIPEDHKYRADLYDPDNRILIGAFADGFTGSAYAPQANRKLFKTCKKYGINTIFNDAARINTELHLDPDDPFTRETAKDNHGINLSDRLIGCEEKDGMSVRNSVMAARALEAAGNGVIIQGCGLSHGGNKTDEASPYENSYLKACRERGAEVTSIFLSEAVNNYTAENIIPEQALIDDPNMIIIDGMPKYQGFTFNSYGDRILEGEHSNKHLIDPEMEL